MCILPQDWLLQFPNSIIKKLALNCVNNSSEVMLILRNGNAKQKQDNKVQSINKDYLVSINIDFESNCKDPKCKF